MTKKEYTCTVEFTEGWQQRVTDAFVSLYYQRLREGKDSSDLGKEKNPSKAAFEQMRL